MAKVASDTGVLYRHKAACKQVITRTSRPGDLDARGVVSGRHRHAAALGPAGRRQDRYDAGVLERLVRRVHAAGHDVGVGGVPREPRSASNYFGRSVFGGTLAAPIWHDYMSRVMAGMPVRGFPAPPAPETEGPRRGRAASPSAQQILAEAGFSSRVEHVASLSRRGSWWPDSRRRRHRKLGTLVTLQVSTGTPPKVKIPDVKGMKRRRGSDPRGPGPGQGRREERHRRELDGVVLSGSRRPAPGEKGSTVTMNVGDEEKQGRAASPARSRRW